MQTLYQEYALLESQLKELETKKEQLRTHILKDMIRKKEEKIETDMGSFTVTKLKTWKYPRSIEVLKENFEAEKARAQSTGDATFTEKESLRFTNIKF